MKVYWTFLILSLIVWFLSARRYRIVREGNHYETRGLVAQGVLLFGVMIFFCGLRSGIADTGTYIQMFHLWPDHFSFSDLMSQDEKGFYLFGVLYKQFISRDFHGWLFIIALISGLAMMIALLRYSASFGFSCFLFIATTTFTYLVNGMRQFICIAIFFCCMSLVLERKFFRYLILVILLSTIHTSAWILLPFYFIARIKPWSGKMWIWLIAVMGIGVGMAYRPDLVESVLGKTDYANYTELLTGGGTGVNMIRLAIVFVPVAISFFARYVIAEIDSPIVNMSVIMSVTNFGIYVIATFTSGMAIGRLAAYFDVYNLILLPWLLKHTFTEDSSKIVTVLCVLLYLLFFFFQMVLTWNLGYESDILHLFC